MNGKEGTITECILGPVPILHMASQHTAAGTQVHTHPCLYNEENSKTEPDGHCNLFLSNADGNKLKNWKTSFQNCGFQMICVCPEANQ